jgi:hypothetical protein
MIGMLWFEDDPKKTMSDRIVEAAAYYREKYSQEPNICFVPVGSEGSTPAGVKLVESKAILPNHLLIGCENGTRQGV